MKLSILKDDLMEEYKSRLPAGLNDRFSSLKDAPISTVDFNFYTSVATVYSSKIEGEQIDLDSYIRHKRDGIAFQPDYTKKIDDLYDAYIFAQSNALTSQNLKEAHKLLTKNILSPEWQGVYRNQHMYVTTDDGKIEYVATSPFLVAGEMDKLWADIGLLLEIPLPAEASFFYAAMLHLVFVKIHPWNDGNGRAGRLLEKWFLSKKLGTRSWYIESEKMYYLQHKEYYQNIRQLGLEYDTLDYSKALSFLLMLPSSLENKDVRPE